ncbi:unnamed protein product [Nezara viridula]|uniref:Uncharacterized protein n=1 Tax=Nezara viridula TaxID=85310 RepID=A0A9P0HEG7_NEZVI|nr:unnamed protein product [Nezara viridula]
MKAHTLRRQTSQTFEEGKQMFCQCNPSAAKGTTTSLTKFTSSPLPPFLIPRTLRRLRDDDRVRTSSWGAVVPSIRPLRGRLSTVASYWSWLFS